MGQFRLDRIAPDTLLGELRAVKISFFRYRYALVAEPILALGVKIASLQDIAAMKLDAVSRRGTKRDFVDRFSLRSQVSACRRRCGGINASTLVST